MTSKPDLRISSVLPPDVDGDGAPCWMTVGIKGAATCARLEEVGTCKKCPIFTHKGKTLFDRPAPPGLKDAWTQGIAKPKEDRQIDLASLLIFRLDREWIALETQLFQGAASRRKVQPLPSRTSPAFPGIVNVEGELLPLVNLLSVLDLTPHHESENTGNLTKNRLLVIGETSNRFVIEADEVLGVHHIESGIMRDIPASVAVSPDTHITKNFEYESRSVGLIDGDLLMRSLKRIVA